MTYDPRTDRVIKSLMGALSLSFGADTCYPPMKKDWANNPSSFGQCAVTSLIVQDYLGGEILYDEGKKHFWNRVDNLEIDFTHDQFLEDPGLKISRIRIREELLKTANTAQRYEILRKRVQMILLFSSLLRGTE